MLHLIRRTYDDVRMRLRSRWFPPPALLLLLLVLLLLVLSLYPRLPNGLHARYSTRLLKFSMPLTEKCWQSKRHCSSRRHLMKQACFSHLILQTHYDPCSFTGFCRQGQHRYLFSTLPHIPTEVNLLILITVKGKLEKIRTVFDTILQAKAKPHDLSHTQTCMLIHRAIYYVLDD